MQQPKPRHIMRIALTRGIIFGIIVEIISLLIDMLNNMVHFTTTIANTISTSGMAFSQASSIVNAVYIGLDLLIVAICSFIVGRIVVNKTDRTSMGLFAGLYTGLTFGIFHILVTLFNLLAFTLPLYANAPHTNLGTIEQQIIMYVLIENITTLILAVFLGTVIGGIGGNLKKRNIAAQSESQSSQAPS